jgi:predicted RNA-binding Zn-ribbon protein involved in translation (DUF1610 family)
VSLPAFGLRGHDDSDFERPSLSARLAPRIVMAAGRVGLTRGPEAGTPNASVPQPIDRRACAGRTRYHLRTSGETMADPPAETEVEIVCPSCGYRMTRTVARLRRETDIVCPECGTVVVHGEGEEGDKS